MFTFNYKRIFGAGWIGDHGSVLADSVSDARSMIMEKLQESDTEAHRWVEQTDGGITTYILEQTEDARIKDSRIEFYQEPSLFGFGDNR